MLIFPMQKSLMYVIDYIALRAPLVVVAFFYDYLLALKCVGSTPAVVGRPPPSHTAGLLVRVCLHGCCMSLRQTLAYERNLGFSTSNLLKLV